MLLKPLGEPPEEVGPPSRFESKEEPGGSSEAVRAPSFSPDPPRDVLRVLSSPAGGGDSGMAGPDCGEKRGHCNAVCSKNASGVESGVGAGVALDEGGFFPKEAGEIRGLFCELSDRDAMSQPSPPRQAPIRTYHSVPENDVPQIEPMILPPVGPPPPVGGPPGLPGPPPPPPGVPPPPPPAPCPAPLGGVFVDPDLPVSQFTKRVNGPGFVAATAGMSGSG